MMTQCQSIFFHVLVWLLLSQRVLSVEVFAFAFDLAVTTLVLVWNLLFLWICRIYCIVFNRIDHIFDRSIGNSDPRMRIVLIHGLNSNFNSILPVSTGTLDLGQFDLGQFDLGHFLRLSHWGLFCDLGQKNLTDTCWTFANILSSPPPVPRRGTPSHEHGLGEPAFQPKHCQPKPAESPKAVFRVFRCLGVEIFRCLGL